MLPMSSIRISPLRLFIFRLFAIFMLFVGLVAAESARAGTTCSMKKLAGSDRVIDPGQNIDQALADALILAEINYNRCMAGLKPLQSDKRVQKVALTHARWMAQVQMVSHRSSVPGQTTLRARISTSGVQQVRVGSENVGMVHRFRIDGKSFRVADSSQCSFAGADGNRIGAHTYGSLAHKIVTLWMKSSGHRVNILDRKVGITGAAVAYNPNGGFCGQYFVAQNFVG